MNDRYAGRAVWKPLLVLVLLGALTLLSRAASSGIEAGAAASKGTGADATTLSDAPRQSAIALPPGAAARLETLLAPFVRYAMLDGTILVDIGGDIVYEHSFGRASHELDVSHDRSTRFRIASLSKNVTDAALGVLIHHGRLSLDTTVDEFLPDFPSGELITLGQIIEHRSGIAHTNAQPWGETALSRDELLRRLATLPLDFEPGTSRSYSNGGYAVLAEVIGRIHGRGYAAAMQEFVFDPLGMTRSGDIENSRDVIRGMATGYEPGPYVGERRHPRPYPAQMRPGGGSLYSTARDMRRFYRAVMEHRLFDAQLTRMLFGNDDEVFTSTGRSPGFSAMVRMDRASDSLIVILLNTYAFPQALQNAVFAVLKGREPDWQDVAILDGPMPENVAERLVGHYRWPDFIGAQGDVYRTTRSNLAFVDRENDYAAALLPLADGSFLFTSYWFRCTPRSEDIDCSPIARDADFDVTLTRMPSPPRP